MKRKSVSIKHVINPYWNFSQPWGKQLKYDFTFCVPTDHKKLTITVKEAKK